MTNFASAHSSTLCPMRARAIERWACLSQPDRLRRGCDRLHHTFFFLSLLRRNCNAMRFRDPLEPLCSTLSESSYSTAQHSTDGKFVLWSKCVTRRRDGRLQHTAAPSPFPSPLSISWAVALGEGNWPASATNTAFVSLGRSISTSTCRSQGSWGKGIGNKLQWDWTGHGVRGWYSRRRCAGDATREYLDRTVSAQPNSGGCEAGPQQSRGGWKERHSSSWPR
ncbi:hypothetical protein V8C34DRAFT_254263 [Trichoderma compactum]